MNPLQRLLACFGRQYVVFIDMDEGRCLRHAFALGSSWYTRPYPTSALCLLLPRGRVVGPHYVKGWHPVTATIKEFHDTLEESKGESK